MDGAAARVPISKITHVKLRRWADMDKDDLFESLNSAFTAQKYNDARINPNVSDPLFFHFKDLLMAIQSIELAPNSVILDYGCGSSPYQSLLKHSIYHKADFLYGDIMLDFEIVNNKIPDAPSAFYDCVLSTQVLEHVSSVSDYLTEARRVLKSDGKLVLTTHGLFEDHACPYDFWRWTAQGLKCELERNGFNVIELYKLTSGKRLALLLFEDSMNCLSLNKKSKARFALKIVKRLYRMFKTRIITQVDTESNSDSMVRVTDCSSGPNKYIAIMAIATKGA